MHQTRMRREGKHLNAFPMHAKIGWTDGPKRLRHRPTMSLCSRTFVLLAIAAIFLATAECKKPKSAAEWREISKKAEEKEREVHVRLLR